MGKRGMIVSILVFILLFFSVLNGEFHEHLYYIHSPAAMALAPNIVSFETGALSSIENPALSSVDQTTGIYYQYTQWNYRNLYIASLKSYYRQFSFSLTAYNLEYYGLTKSLIGNLSARLGAGFTLGVNVNFLNEYFSSGVKHLSDLDADAGINYCGKIKTGKISNCLTIGLASNSISSIKDYSISDISLKGGVSYSIADEEDAIPLFDRATVFAEYVTRFFMFEMPGGFNANYLTYGGELRILDGLAFRIGYTKTELSIEEYFEPPYRNNWSLNYGIGYSMKIDKQIFTKNPLFIKMDLCKIPLYHDVYWYLFPYEENPPEYSFSFEISTKFDLNCI